MLSGCGGSHASSDTGQLRFVQASPDAPQINLLADGKNVASDLLYMNSSGYVSLAAGSHNIQAVAVNGSQAILSSTVSIAPSKNQTILLTGLAANPQSLLLADGGTKPATAGDAELRVVNAAVSITAADVYIVAAGSGLAKPAASNLAFNKDTGYLEFGPGNYQIFLTAPGTVSVLLGAGPINVTSSQNLTIVALDNPAGGFTFTVLTDQ